MGWYDIGYNFLIDKYGTIYEGRYGSIAGNPIGAQVLGFNEHSMGVALIGTFDTVKPTQAAVGSLEQLLAWKLDLAHVDPSGTAHMVCTVSQKFRAGQIVSLPVIAGHRDANYTDCPGNQLYDLLPRIRQAVAAIGQPKIYDPSLSTATFDPKGAPAVSSVTVEATVSQAASWQVTVRNTGGQELRSYSGSGTQVSANWDGRDTSGAVVPDGTYSLLVTATNQSGSARAASLAVSVLTTPPVFSDLTGGVVSPNGDGIDDTTTLSYRISRPCQTRIVVSDAAGTVLRVLQGWSEVARGAHSVSWNGKLAAGGSWVAAVDGRDTFTVYARDALGLRSQAAGTVTVNSTLGFPLAVPHYFSPNRDGHLDTTAFAFRLERSASVGMSVTTDRGVVVRSFALGTLASGAHSAIWDGRSATGVVLPSGRYGFTVTAINSLGSIAVAGSLVLDDFVPQVTLPSKVTAARGRAAKITYRLSDPYTDRLRVTIQITTAVGTVVKSISAGWLVPGSHTLAFTPKLKGSYDVVVEALDRAMNRGLGETVLTST
jgi:flagellar hook assembly protein FlgD